MHATSRAMPRPLGYGARRNSADESSRARPNSALVAAAVSPPTAKGRRDHQRLHAMPAASIARAMPGTQPRECSTDDGNREHAPAKARLMDCPRSRSCRPRGWPTVESGRDRDARRRDMGVAARILIASSARLQATASTWRHDEIGRAQSTPSAPRRIAIAGSKATWPAAPPPASAAGLPRCFDPFRMSRHGPPPVSRKLAPCA